MNEIPSWWLLLSALFFVCGIAVFGAMCFLMLNVIRMVKALEPKTAALLDSVTSLSSQTRELVGKVEGLTARVNEVAENVRGMTSSAKSTVDNVSTQATSLAHLVQESAAPAAKKFQAIAPYIGMAMAGLKVLAVVREFRAAIPKRPKKSESPREVEK